MPEWLIALCFVLGTVGLTTGIAMLIVWLQDNHHLKFINQWREWGALTWFSLESTSFVSPIHEQNFHLIIFGIGVILYWQREKDLIGHKYPGYLPNRGISLNGSND